MNDTFVWGSNNDTFVGGRKSAGMDDTLGKQWHLMNVVMMKDVMSVGNGINDTFGKR